ncbi:hypothetical protein D3C71_906410 [compost metagenome]
MGGATDRAIVSAFAPGYTAVTITVGGAISGNLVMGKLSIPTTPRMTNKTEITVANTGRFIIFFNMNCCFIFCFEFAFARQPAFPVVGVRILERYNGHPVLILRE